MTMLFLALQGQWFDQIADGTKAEEYRLATPYWNRRLDGRTYQLVVLTRGYPAGGGVLGSTRLVKRWRGARRTTITHPHFGPDPVEVWAIDVSEDA